MDELPAYSWHGSDHRSVERKGGDTHTHWNIDTNGVGCWLGGGSLVASSLDFCRYAVDVYSSAGIGGRAKQIFGAKPLKTRDQPTDELICFPCDAAFFVFFFPSFFPLFFISLQQPVTPPPPSSRLARLFRPFSKRPKSSPRHLSDEIRKVGA